MTDTEKMKKHITSTKRLGEVLLSPLAVITMRSRSRSLANSPDGCVIGRD